MSPQPPNQLRFPQKTLWDGSTRIDVVRKATGIRVVEVTREPDGRYLISWMHPRWRPSEEEAQQLTEKLQELNPPEPPAQLLFLPSSDDAFLRVVRANSDIQVTSIATPPGHPAKLCWRNPYQLLTARELELVHSRVDELNAEPRT